MTSSHVSNDMTPAECGVYRATGGKLSDYSDAQAVQIFLSVTFTITCPLGATFNLLVIIAVKTKGRLRAHKSNVLLACLAVTDLAVSVIVQPMLIAQSSLNWAGGTTSSNVSCALHLCAQFITSVLCESSLFHLILISGERCLAMKHAYAYSNGLVTEVRLLVSSGLAWLLSLILHIPLFVHRSVFYATNIIFMCISLAIIIFCHVTVYREVCRHQKTLLTQQVTEEARQKFLRDKKVFKLTATIIIVLFFCYLPVIVFRFVLSQTGFMSSKAGFIFASFSVSFAIYNSFLNPLIYAIRKRQFRVAFIELLCRNTNLAEAQEIEKKVFGSPNAVGVSNGQRKKQEEKIQSEGRQISNLNL